MVVTKTRLSPVEKNAAIEIEEREGAREIFQRLLFVHYLLLIFFFFADLSFLGKWRTTLLVQPIEQAIRLVQEPNHNNISMKNNHIMPMNDQLVDKVTVEIVDEVLG